MKTFKHILWVLLAIIVIAFIGYFVYTGVNL